MRLNFRALAMVALAWPMALSAEEAKSDWAQFHRGMLQFDRLREAQFPRVEWKLGELGILEVGECPEWIRGTVYFRNGNWRLSRSGVDRQVVNFYGSGSYAVLLNAHSGRHYLSGSDLIEFDLEIDASGEISKVEPKAASKGLERFPNAWYLKTADYLSFRKAGRFELGEKPDVQPSVTLTEQPGRKVLRTELAPELEKHLFWVVYQNGKLKKREQAEGIKEVSLDAEKPATHTVMVVAETGGIRVLVSQVLVAWFPDLPDSDGDGLPDEWESEAGLDRLDGTDATESARGSRTHLEKYRAHNRRQEP